MLSSDDVRHLLEMLQWETVFEDGKVRLSRRVSGWSKDPTVGRLQAMLSLMLEVAGTREASGG